MRSDIGGPDKLGQSQGLLFFYVNGADNVFEKKETMHHLDSIHCCSRKTDVHVFFT
jgi:hypothetical protein